jgi:hypothetical protein
MKLFKTGLIILALFSVGACSSMKIEDFKDTQPAFTLEEYFLGKTTAWGLFEDRFGNVQRQFVVDITGTWDEDTLILREDFVYDDGEKETRVWRIVKMADGSYEGTTENAIGTAEGQLLGNAFHWTYGFNLKVGDDYWKVKFDDWMFMQANGVLLNKATVTRWGFTLGTVFISFSKPADQAAAAAEIRQSAGPLLSVAASQ